MCFKIIYVEYGFIVLLIHRTTCVTYSLITVNFNYFFVLALSS